MIWLACDSCVIALLPLWRSPPENTDTSWDTFAACSRPEQLMCYRQTRLVAEALLDFCKWRHSARHFICLLRRTQPLRCIPMSASRPLLYDTWNTFTITFALNKCSLMAYARPSVANCFRICPGPGWESN